MAIHSSLLLEVSLSLEVVLMRSVLLALSLNPAIFTQKENRSDLRYQETDYIATALVRCSVLGPPSLPLPFLPSSPLLPSLLHTDRQTNKHSVSPFLTYLALFEVGGHQDVACPEPLVDVPHHMHVLHALSHLTAEAHQLRPLHLATAQVKITNLILTCF